MYLYERWQCVAAKSGDAVALRDRQVGRSWTFAELAAAVDKLPTSSAVTVTQATGSELILQTLAAWRDGVAFCPLEANGPEPPITEGDPLPAGVVHVKLTSGSTGQPRGVMFRAEQLVADADNIVETMGLKSEWPNLGVISLTHSYGFSNLVLPLLLHGIPLDWLGDPLPAAVHAALLGEGDRLFADHPYTLAAVPAMWRAWHAAGVIDADRIALAISAGAPLPGDLERKAFATSGVKIHNFYGSSECGGIAYDRSESPRDAREVIGQAMANVELSINDDGCLVIGGAAVGEGYWPSSQENSEQLGGGRFVTSDLAELLPADTGDSAPMVALSGRRDDLINVAGRKVSPPRVEAAILREAAVKHCVVFGVPSSEPSRVHDSVAVVAPAENFDLEALKSGIAERLQPYEMPRRWWINASLEPDSRGKFSRSKWRQRFLEQADSNA